MDILRKIGDWAWINKERLVLAILVIFLGYRIYAVMNPTTIEEQTAQAAAAARSRTATPAAAAGDTGVDGVIGDGLAGEGVAGEGQAGEGDSPAARLRRLQRGRQGTETEAGETTTTATETRPVEQPLVFTQHMPPKRIPDPASLPEDWTEEEGRPPTPPANPLPPPPVAYTALVKDNPFTATTTTDDGTRTEERPPELQLLDIKPMGDNAYRAYIQTRARKWYREGEQFESYQLVSIDPEAGTVEIFSERHGRSFMFSLNR